MIHKEACGLKKKERVRKKNELVPERLDKKNISILGLFP